MRLENIKKVSVIVAAYNVENYIYRCVESVIKQTLLDIEIIIVNDGSTDRTLKILNYLASLDKRIKIINKKNAGLIEARKTGITNATGEFVLFVDGDDWIREDACNMLYNEAKKEKVDIVYFNLSFIKNNKIKNNYIYDFKYAKGYEYLQLVLSNRVRANIVLQFIRRKFILDNRIKFPDNINYGEDLAITVNLALKKPNVCCLNEAFYFYYQRCDSMTNNQKDNHKLLQIQKVVDDIEENIKNEKIYYTFKDEIEYMKFIHLFYYRVIAVKRVNNINKYFYKKWDKNNKLIEENRYYTELYKKSRISIKIKFKLYNINFEYGYLYTTLKYKLLYEPINFIKIKFNI